MQNGVELKFAMKPDSRNVLKTAHDDVMLCRPI